MQHTIVDIYSHTYFTCRKFFLSIICYAQHVTHLLQNYGFHSRIIPINVTYLFNEFHNNRHCYVCHWVVPPMRLRQIPPQNATIKLVSFSRHKALITYLFENSCSPLWLRLPPPPLLPLQILFFSSFVNNKLLLCKLNLRRNDYDLIIFLSCGTTDMRIW